MAYYKDYVAGRMKSSIHEFLREFPRSSRRMNYCLISSLDSNLAPGSLLDSSPELRTLRRGATVVGRGILIRTRDLLDEIGDRRLFFGFDEVWFFPSGAISPKPSSAWLIGPSRITQDAMDELGGWMERNSCALGLGDGCGLNYVLKVRGLVRSVILHSIDQ